MRNRRDAFSHSEQCDKFFEQPSPVIGGVPHTSCFCWCHSAVNLFTTPDFEPDPTPPPEWLSSADRAFMESPLGDRSRSATDAGEAVNALKPTSPINEPDWMKFSTPCDESWSLPQADSAAGETGKPSGGVGKFGKRSAHELATGKCDTCGDLLKDCECVE